MAKANRKQVWNENDEADMGIGTLIIFIALVLVAAVAATLIISVAGQLQQQAQHTSNIALQDVSSGLMVVKVQGDRAYIGTNGTYRGDLNGVIWNNVADTIQVIEMKLKLNPGSLPVDMDRVVIEISDGKKAVSMELNGNITQRKYCDNANWFNSSINQSEWDPTNTTQFDSINLGGDNSPWNASNYAQEANYFHNEEGLHTAHYTAQILEDPSEHASFATPLNSPGHVLTQGTLIKVYINCNDLGLSIDNQRHVKITIVPQYGVATVEEFSSPSVYVDRYVDLV